MAAKCHIKGTEVSTVCLTETDVVHGPVGDYNSNNSKLNRLPEALQAMQQAFCSYATAKLLEAEQNCKECKHKAHSIQQDRLDRESSASSRQTYMFLAFLTVFVVFFSYLFATVPDLNQVLHQFQIDIYAVVPMTLHTNDVAWWGATVFFLVINFVLFSAWFTGGHVESLPGEMHAADLHDVRVFLQAAEMKIQGLKAKPAISSAVSFTTATIMSSPKHN